MAQALCYKDPVILPDLGTSGYFFVSPRHQRSLQTIRVKPWGYGRDMAVVPSWRGEQLFWVPLSGASPNAARRRGFRRSLTRNIQSAAPLRNETDKRPSATVILTSRRPGSERNPEEPNRSVGSIDADRSMMCRLTGELKFPTISFRSIVYCWPSVGWTKTGAS